MTFPEYVITWKELSSEDVSRILEGEEKLHKITVMLREGGTARHELYVSSYKLSDGYIELDPREIRMIKVVAPGIYKYYTPVDFRDGAKLIVPLSRVLYIEDPIPSRKILVIALGFASLLLPIIAKKVKIV